MGKIMDLNRFDSTFFGLMDELVFELKPAERMVLETAYEAIMDAGINPEQLRGSRRVGVFIGTTVYSNCDYIRDEIQPDVMTPMEAFTMINTTMVNIMLANRLSYVFDLRGPSMVIDTACSASLSALNVALNDLKQGNIDYAVIAGIHTNLQPMALHVGQETGLLSPRGQCCPLDESADGFVKGEAVCCVLLQRRQSACRVYASVRSAGINNDGKKTIGMFCPSSEAQEELMVDTYTKAGIDPLDLTYIEAHITGTKAGDPAEVRAIYRAYCERTGRTQPLLLGTLKGNMGHSEGASGLTSLIKVMIAFENECIPPNINLKNLKQEFRQYCPPLLPVTQKLKYKPGLAAVNNFGIGGVNDHVIVEPNPRVPSGDSHRLCEPMARLVLICGRTEESVKHIMNFIESSPKKVTKEFVTLLCRSMKYTPNVNSTGFPVRGSIIINETNDGKSEVKYSYKRQISVMKDKTLPPLWMVFPGLGGQWPAMAKALMPIKIFADKVEECHQILHEFKIDLKYMLLSDDKTSMSTMTANTRDAMIVTYFRGAITESDPQIPKGLMAVVGLSRAEALNVCPEGVFVVCNNAKESVVISGLKNEMKKTIDLLNKTGVFVRQLESSEIPFHSEYLRSSAQPMVDAIKKYMLNPRLRSKKWLSTSVMVSEPEDERLRYASAEYFVYNFMHPVQFYDQLKHISTGAVVLELSPHSLFKKIITESVDSCQYISLISKDSNHKNVDQFLSGISKLYELGFNPSVERLYPPIQWPVPRSTPSISSLLKWDHSRDLSTFTAKYPENMLRYVCGDMNVVVNIGAKKDDYLCDHVVDGNNLFPATGYLMLAWRQMAASYGQTWDKVPAVFEKCQFLRATLLSADAPTRLTVKYFQHSGEFIIMETNILCAVGTVRRGADDMLTEQHLISDGQPVVSECEYRLDRESIRKEMLPDGQPVVSECEYRLDRESIRKEMHIRGYEYSKGFQSLLNIRTADFSHANADIEWTGNMVTFLDGLLQLAVNTVNPFRKLVVPVMIDAIRVDPNTLFEAVKRNRLADEVVDTNDGYEVDGTNISGVDICLADYVPNSASERFAIFSSRLPVVFDSSVNCVLTYGAEVYNMVTAPITRKTDPNMVLERHQFIPNDDNTAIDDRHRKLLIDNIEIFTPFMGIGFTRLDPRLVGRHRAFEWDIKESLILKTNHLLVLRYSHHLWELDLQDLIQDLSDAIESNGFLLTVFRYKVTEPEIALNSLFGNSVTDSDLEKRINDFMTYGNEMGLRVICSKCDTIGSKAVLFRKVSEPILPDKQNIIRFNDKCEQWFPVLKDRLLMASELGADSPRVWLIASDSCYNGVMGLAKSLRLEPGGEHFRYIFIYDKNTANTDIDFNTKPFSDILANDLVSNVIRDGKLGSYRYQSFCKNFNKIKSNEYYLGLGKGRDLSSIEWTDATSAPITDTYYDVKNKLRQSVKIEIYCLAIIFRDVLIATGEIPALSDLFEQQIGHEFAGRQADTGERVMGINHGKCVATSTRVDPYLFTTIPDNWSMEEAVTILSPYFTVWYGLIERAHIRRGEIVLIHSAAGGVGQAAINVCQHYGCDIYATVGTEEKKQFLINTYKILENKIFSSRSIEFKSQVMRSTAGRGVDVVLNSLAGDKLDASYECVGTGGRFVELGKMDMFMNKKLPMYNLLRDLCIICVSLDESVLAREYVWDAFYTWVHQNCTNGCVKPLNRTVFPAEDAEKAFRYMTTGKHIGKIVIRIREEEANRKPWKCVKPADSMTVSTKTYFNPNKTYIITGGLGGFGLELCQWMVYNGAACAYADGCLSTRDAMIVTYFRGAITESDPQIPRGLMAVVGLSKAEALNVCPKGVFVVCNNAKESVVISGPKKEMVETIDLLNKRGLFVRQLESNELPFHSEYLRSSAQPMVDAINEYMPNSRLRSRKWLSTSVMVSEPEDERLRYASAEYFVHNLMHPVQFYDRLKHIPTGAVVLELSPHSVFGKIMAESVDNCQYISLISKNSNHKNINQFLSGISKLYELGFNPSVERLYPPIQWPVPRSTPSISSLIKWDHSRDLSVYTSKWPQNKLRSVSGDMNVVVNIGSKKDDYLCDHVVDGNNLFPATGYLMLAWRQMAASYGQTWNKVPAIFSKCQFLRATFLAADVSTRLTVKYYKRTGDYSIEENDIICAVGTVRRGADDMLTDQHIISDGQPMESECEYRLDRESIKKEMHIRGYEYSKGFQSLTNMRTNDFSRVSADIEWTGNMVTFLDSLLQITGCLFPFRKLVVPVMIDAIRVDPNTLFEALKRNRLADNVEDTADGQVVDTTNKEEFTRCLNDNFNSNYNNNLRERFQLFRSQLPIIFDSLTNCVLTYGAEVFNMVTAPIAKKTDPNMVLERHEFIANDDNMAIDDRHRKLLIDNIEVFTDSDLEKRINNFTTYGNEMGLRVICNKCDTIGSKAVLFRKVSETILPDKQNIIHINGKCEQWFPLLKDRLLMASELGADSPRVWLIANDSCINGVMGLAKSLRLEPGGKHFRYIFNYDKNTTNTEIDFNTKPFSDILANDLVSNVIKDGSLGSYRYQSFEKDFDKIQSNEYYLSLGKGRDLSSLEWTDATNFTTTDHYYDVTNKKRELVNVEIYCSSVIFRDVLIASGKIPVFSKISDQQIGHEFAGRRADTGERVMGINHGKSVATSTRVDPFLFTTIPDNWSIEEAVTILSPYFTVWYGLLERAHIRRGESILIHSAAGGVGQAAINVCQHYGCDIYATVGTEEKKQFLINTYKIPAKKIFSSRSTQFKSQVMRSTAGRGVDLVLNSLAGDKLDASYECVGTGGRFVELGKMDLFQNRKLPMYNLLRDLSIIAVSLDESVLDREHIWHTFYSWVHHNCSNGCVKPLNWTVFSAAEAEMAFRYMTTGKHIGKIVIRIREEEKNKKPLKLIKSADKLTVSTKTYFNPNKSYIITGGLGGFGLELCQWMVYMGAKRLVLTSRSGLKNDYQKYIVNRLKAFGKTNKAFKNQIIVSTADCLTIEGTKQLLDECKELGAPIGGVFHLALELNNCLFSEVSFETFMKTVDIKEKICQNLDQFSRELDYYLDYFVVFSSLSSGLGIEGQLNYTYGNSICERICEQRQRDGLSGLAVQFGPIGDVGVMSDMTQTFAFTTTQKQRIHSCCEVLDKLLAVQYPVVSVNVKTVENSLLKLDTETKEGSKWFIHKLWGSLGIDPSATPADTTLGEIGIESIFASELQQEMGKLCNQTIQLKFIKDMSVGLLREFESEGDDNIKGYFNGIKKAQISLLKYRFVIPVETHVRLNGVSNGKPLYLMPTLEMGFALYDHLVQNINRPVVGLNWTPVVNRLSTLKEVMKYFTDLMARLEPNGGYDVLGSTDGAIICGQLLRKGLAEKAVMIDVLSKQRFREDDLKDDMVLELILNCLLDDLPIDYKRRILRDSCDQNIKSRVKRIGAELREFVGKAMISQDLDLMLETMVKRIRMLWTYRLNKKQKFGNDFKTMINKKWPKMNDKFVVILMSSQLDSMDDNSNEYLNTSNHFYLIPNSEDLPSNITTVCVDTSESIQVTNTVIVEKLVQIFNK
ncbi:unnamed protein product [Medioppia subpectinata]|uniref:Uncharacterized protein n=1 Tax=Medioppia subpectinata TaxID=1979941 RepID=A0A7R9KEP5_9ACAR|nr:unnamed protein product [Medioppia subpectinata]CAG2101211.1 unnamed protein product [Medioppia subpectinata]